jgi:hypothetical protein
MAGAFSMKRSDMLDLVVARLPPIVFKEYGQMTVCIPAAYHCQEILRAKGIPARLASMNVVAMNTTFQQWYEGQGQGDQAPLPPKAWSVGVTENNPDGEGYLSHLVVVSKGKVIDCASGQLSRPQHDMPIPGGLVVKPGVVWGDGESSLIIYEPSKEPVPPMWRLDPDATARVRERIQVEILKDL